MLRGRMSGAGAAEAVRGESPLPGGRKRELPVVAGLAQPILKGEGSGAGRLRLDSRRGRCSNAGPLISD